MSVSSDSAEQVMKIMLEGEEICLKATGKAAIEILKYVAVFLKSHQQTQGKTKLINLVKSGKQLDFFGVKKEDLPKLEELLNICFAHDPLYETLIPDPDVRKRLMPELFHCDMDEFYETCEIFADSEELNSVLVVSDETESYNLFHFLLTEAKATLQNDIYLIKEDPSFHTFYNFIKGGDYLNSSWTQQLHQTKRLHIIYLAVHPRMQHHGMAAMLMDEAIRYAQEHGMMISLETHNEKNLEFYKKFQFKEYGILKKNFNLKQYCLIREYQ